MENNPTENQTDTNIQLNVKKNGNENDVTVPPETVNKDKGIINETKVFEWENSRNNMDKIFENIFCENSLKNLCINRNNSKSHNHLFSHTVKPRLPITNQKSSGRCWIFAALNVARREMIEQYKIKDFEFSQSYLFFWDKLERFNYNLNCIIETKGENIESETVRHILSDPISDGGQWDMIVNIVEKYGLVPKSCYKESFHSGKSTEMNNILQKKFRKSAYDLRNSNNPIEDKNKIMKDVYKLLCCFLGTPPKIFEWEYYDSSNKYNKSKKISPLNFYKECVPFDFKDYVCVINDTRKEHGFNQLFTVKFLGNVLGGNKVTYLNLEIKKLKELVERSLIDNKAVWFGCDVGQHLNRSNCAMDLDLVDYTNVLTTDLNMNKEERLLSKESLMTHAMCITGFNRIDDYNHIIDKWQVENSWGKSEAAEGYYIMTDKWFEEYVYEIAIHKKYLSKEQNNILELNEHTILKPWDPMGSLAF